MNSVLCLVAGNTVQGVAKLLIGVVYKAGAVKTGFRGSTAPAVVIANELKGKVCHLAAFHCTAGIRGDGVGIAAFLHILGIYIAGLPVIYNGGPVAGGAGNGQPAR